MNSRRPKQPRRLVKFLLPALVLAGLVIAYRTLPVREWLAGESGLITRIEGLGPAGWAIFIAVYILLTVLAGPAWLFTMAAGLVFGLGRGTVLVSIGSVLGATAAFLLGRYLAREAIAGKVAGNPRFRSIDAAVAERGFYIVLLTRLSPVFPFTLLNYAYGLTGVSLGKYFFASWIGMLPGTVMYVYLGSLGQAVTREADTGMLLLRIAGFVATAAVTLYITRIARRAIVNACPGGECFLEKKEHLPRP